MKAVEISEARNNLSRYLRYVRNGGRVRIYDRNTPVADLVPIEPVVGQDDKAVLASLIRRGVIRPARERGPLPADFFEPGCDLFKARLAEAVVEDRQEGEDAILGPVRPRPRRRPRT